MTEEFNRLRYRKKNICKTSNFLGLKVLNKIFYKIIRYCKKSTTKTCNFLDLKVTANTWSTISSSLESGFNVKKRNKNSSTERFNRKIQS